MEGEVKGLNVCRPFTSPVTIPGRIIEMGADAGTGLLAVGWYWLIEKKNSTRIWCGDQAPAKNRPLASPLSAFAFWLEKYSSASGPWKI